MSLVSLVKNTAKHVFLVGTRSLLVKQNILVKSNHLLLLRALSTRMNSTVIDWSLNEVQIKSMGKKAIEDARSRCKSIVESKTKDDSILKKLNEMERLFGNDMALLSNLQSVSPDKSKRDACTEIVAEMNKLAIEITMDVDLYKTLEETKENVYDKLDRESKRYLDHMILERRLDGLHLDAETREKVKALKEKISDLQIEYSKNCTEESTKLKFTCDQLAGVNENLLNSLPKDETTGEFIVSLKYPVYFPVMKECRVPETRRKLIIAFDSRCLEENTKIFEQVLEYRSELAHLLGFKNFSEYNLPLLCAKTPENVQDFLDRLKEKLILLQRQELDKLLEYKKNDCQELGIPFDGKLNPSDMRYYTNMREQKEFMLDQSKLQEYFPLNVVIDGTFKIYQSLLGLIFEEVKGEALHHPEAKMYRVKDEESKETIGYFYTDLHPRDGKYGHAAVFPLREGCLKQDGERQLPVNMMVCNFTKPTEDKPSLLTHDEVETFFHEFGHSMHNVCARANYHKFGGTSVETDFVEAPSQMLENWVWNKESLNLLSAHYKDGSKIDDKLLNDLIRSKNASSGVFNMRQILLAKMDQYFHTHDKSDTRKIYHQFAKEYMLYELEADHLNMNASFEHLVGGYEARYYSYLWSEVYSADMFESRFNKEGVLNPKTGKDYRRCILEPGGSLDAKQMVMNFIGREPNEIAFLKHKGLKI